MKISQNSKEDTCRLDVWTLWKKRLWFRCFPVTPFLQNTCGRLLLNMTNTFESRVRQITVLAYVYTSNSDGRKNFKQYIFKRIWLWYCDHHDFSRWRIAIHWEERFTSVHILKIKEYSRSNSNNLPLPIQNAIIWKTKNILLQFYGIFETYIKGWTFFYKKMSLINYFRNYWLRKTWLIKCIKCPVSENPSAVNILTSPKNCCNLQKITFILLFHHAEPNWVRKSHF